MNKSFLFLFLLLGLCVMLYAAQTLDTPNFEYPKWFVTIMNLIFVPLICNVIKKITPVRELRFLIACVLSGLTALIGIVIGKYSWSSLPEFIILAFIAAQLAYNLFWQRILQPEKR